MNTEVFAARYAAPFKPLTGALPVCAAEIDAQDWIRIAQTVRSEGGRLVSIWGTDRRPLEDRFVVSAVYCAQEGLLWLRLTATEQDGYPDLSSVFPAASRMQRAVFDSLGLQAIGAEDNRPWINHGTWPRDYFPLRQQYSGRERFDGATEDYPFVSVAGDGVHEIAVGPLHAGIIEPGHFRFSVVGEKVLRLEERLGYTHKGTEKLFAQRPLADGHRIAGRVAGDSTVAFAWAYCMAAEAAVDCKIPVQARWLRALMLERERIANHLGDLGALGNDAGLAIGLAQFMLLKEEWLRLNDRLFGHRFMMDCVVPGGVAVAFELDRTTADLLGQQFDRIEREVQALRVLYEEHAGLQDRFISAGRVTPKLASELGLCGLAGRASGQAFDARADQPAPPYARFNVRMATHRNGDVAARVIVRFEEIFESLRLLRDLVQQMPPGPTAIPLPEVSSATGLGWIEGWRGPVLIAVETDAEGKILRCHCHDPSWHNWPVLEHAIMGNIVPDFPLINKSFNLNYSGHDL
jgi:Ni,Fe-hydrogenase III large subunit/Ni,Fe-hydrogenase III component G